MSVFTTVSHERKYHYRGFDVCVTADVFRGKEVEEWGVSLNGLVLALCCIDNRLILGLVVPDTRNVDNTGLCLLDPATVTVTPSGEQLIRLTSAVVPGAGRVMALSLSQVQMGVSVPIAYIKPYIDHTLGERAKEPFDDFKRLCDKLLADEPSS